MDLSQFKRPIENSVSGQISIPMNHMTAEWVRRWDDKTRKYYWENRHSREKVDKNPYLFDSEDEIPEKMRNQWFEVYDERMRQQYYVNPTLGIEQWDYPNSTTEVPLSTRVVKAYYMKDFAKDHYELSRGYFKKYTLESRLLYEPGELDKPLLKMSTGLAKIALLVNHHIVSYCKDRDKNHIQHIIAFMIVFPKVITEECYCQLYKQLNKCTSQVVFDRTIEILLVVCASILPTPTLLPYIEFFVSTLTSSQRDLCYSYLTQCKQIGTREEMCALEEIDVLLNNDVMSIEISLVDGKTLELEISPLAIIRDVIDAICKRMGLGNDSRLFQIFLVSEDDEWMIAEKRRVVDVLNHMKESMRLQFCVGYYYPIDIFNPQSVELVYNQCVHDIRIGKYFHKEEDYYNCIALILQQRLQDFLGDHRLLCGEIDQLLPPPLLIPSKRLLSEGEIIKIYSKLKGFTPRECKFSLMEYMNAWKDYGVTHFLGNQILPIKEEDRLFGICPRGILLGSYKNRLYNDAYTDFFPFSAIAAWGISSGSISFYLRTKPKQTRYSFILQYAQDAFDIIQTYSKQ